VKAAMLAAARGDRSWQAPLFIPREIGWAVPVPTYWPGGFLTLRLFSDCWLTCRPAQPFGWSRSL